MADLKRDIRYIDRDFNSFRNALIDYSKTYFPDTYNDFSQTSTGMLFMEMASYVGDVLGFYIDNQIQENFITTSRQIPNLFRMCYMLGYQPKVTTASSVEISLYQTVPAVTSGSLQVPDFSYALLIPENTQISSNVSSSVKFLIEDVVDFSASNSLDPTEISIYELSGNQPSSFLLKKKRKAISAAINEKQFVFGVAEKFATVEINASNIIGILDCKDSDDNEWYEVPNLAQEMVFDSIRNTNVNDPNYSEDTEVPYILQLKQVEKRFASRFLDTGSLQLQFGAGSTGNNTEEIIPNPDNVGSGLPFERTQLTTAFSPVNFVFTDTYGVAPSNTTLTVRYLTGGGVASNAPSDTITNIDTTNISFINQNISNTTLANNAFNSIAANNEQAADGGQDGDTIEEIRQNALGNFQNQLRTVTPQDYLIRTLSMPSNLGVVAKAHAAPCKVDDYQLGEVPTILDLYILTYDVSKKLRTASSILKRNLQTYLAEYRMINDAIKIKDAFVVNIGVEFDIVVLPNYNNNEVITNCITELQTYFDIDSWQINEPILMKNLYILLDKIDGVQTVNDVRINNKVGEALGYSQYAYDIPGATLKNVVYPSIDPMIFEVKYPNVDIKGRVVPF
jgi:hypothetical protein